MDAAYSVAYICALMQYSQEGRGGMYDHYQERYDAVEEAAAKADTVIEEFRQFGDKV